MNLTPREIMDCDVAALERVIETLSDRYMRELVCEPRSDDLLAYLKLRIDTLFKEWITLHSHIQSLPPIIDLSRRAT